MSSGALELAVVPGGRGRSLEQRSPTTRVAVGEVRALLVPGDLEEPALHAMVEPRAAEHELAQPVDERLALDRRDRLPVADDVPAELGARRLDEAGRDELD